MKKELDVSQPLLPYIDKILGGLAAAGGVIAVFGLLLFVSWVS